MGGLERALRKAVEGEVRFDSGSLGLYAQDASNFRQVPIGVVVPRTLEDVVAVHKVCHRFGAPVLNRGGCTSLSGETVNEAVVIGRSARHPVRAAREDRRVLGRRTGGGRPGRPGVPGGRRDRAADDPGAAARR
ncbi:FAD-binding oxidoreductase [Streptomyces bluensis]|uniref:FAD-binding oxidoreductase n=1 Tax=Streptomyces bluensis TaxID=33897 RepID=UPI003686E196